ncbi:MAG: T9SS type A sorting domain-containing protein [Chitinophagales bacterium]
MKHTTLFVIVLLLLKYNSNCQGFYSFDITPITATTNDTISATFSIEFPTNLSGKNMGALIFKNDTVLYQGCYWNNSNAQALSYVEDTFHLNNLQSGLYHLIIVASYTVYWTDTTCFQTNTAWNDTIDTTFTVTQFLGLPNTNTKYPSIYPNPTTAQLIIESQDLAIAGVNIYNATGSLMMAVQLNSKYYLLNTEALAPGIYIAAIKTQQGSVRKRWVKM